YWIRSGTAGFNLEAGADPADHFYLPDRYTDPFGKTTRLAFDEYDLFPASSTDPLENIVRVVDFDYRALAPSLLEAINGNLSEARFDMLGQPVAVAVKGNGTDADHLDGVDTALRHPSAAEAARLFDERYDEEVFRRLLGTATMRFVYSFGESVAPDGRVSYGARPAAACSIARETHVARLGGSDLTRFQVSFEYSDGGGNVLVKKAQAEPARNEAALRWVASGKIVVNNKGNPVKQYE